MINPTDFKLAVQAVDALGATPAVLVKVVALAKDPGADISTICDLLRNDGPLVADIIRIGNSPYYSPAIPFGNLTDAVRQIGMRELIWVINLSLSRQLFARDLPSYGITAYEYWSAAVASALVMEALAKELRLDAEDAHTIGILHAIGCMLIDRVIEEKGLGVFRESHRLLADWEQTTVGCDFAEAGAMLLDHWSFPPAMCEVIRWQADRTKVKEPVSLLGALQFTGRLLAATGLEFERKDWHPPEEDPFTQAAGLTPKRLSQLVAKCREDILQIHNSVDWK